MIGTAGNPNTAKLTYSNDPNNNQSGTGTTKDTPDDIVKTYLSQISILKVDGGGKSLAGATFGLYDAAGRNLLKYTTTKDGNVIVIETNGETDAEVAVDANGKLTFSGLKAGKYVLREVSAPAGYNKLTDDITITLTCSKDNEKNGDITDLVVEEGDEECVWSAEVQIGNNEPGEGVVSADEEGNITIKVTNKSGTLFPSTGGIGTTIFYTVGLAMVLGAGALFVVKRKETAK